MVRLVLHPLDCVKTTVQAEMGRGSAGKEDTDNDGGWNSTVRGILNKGGVGELLRGIDLSTVITMIMTLCFVSGVSQQVVQFYL